MTASAPRLAAALLATLLALPHADASALDVVAAVRRNNLGRRLADADGGYGGGDVGGAYGGGDDPAPVDTTATDEPDMAEDVPSAGEVAPAPPNTEGDEGDEGNEGAMDPDDDNEGNEGDEGNEGGDDTATSDDSVDATDDSDDVTDDAADVSAGGDDSDGGAAGDPEWPVCVSGESEKFGNVDGDRPDGITVYADGRCVVSEYAGGFDGFFSTEAGNDHEEGLARAAAQMLGEEDEVEVGKEGAGEEGNERVNRFLDTMRKNAQPLENLDFPEDEGRADGGVRQKNVDRVSAACTELITVQEC